MQRESIECLVMAWHVLHGSVINYVMAQMSHRSSHRPYGQPSTFMYIFHLISIDLQLSRLLNSPTLQSL